MEGPRVIEIGVGSGQSVGFMVAAQPISHVVAVASWYLWLDSPISGIRASYRADKRHDAAEIVNPTKHHNCLC